MKRPHDHLIRKRGLYYRPNKQGYTADPRAAGRYTREDAEMECCIEPMEMTAIHEAALPPDPRVALVQAHFEEWHGAAPEVTEVLTLLARIDGEFKSVIDPTTTPRPHLDPAHGGGSDVVSARESKTTCAECGRDRADREPHRPGCIRGALAELVACDTDERPYNGGLHDRLGAQSPRLAAALEKARDLLA